jgi:hypothetical protein
MNLYLLIASGITFFLGLVHSALGEVIILRHLPNVQGFPPILKSDLLPKWTIRITWHIATILGWGVAAVLAHFSQIKSFGSGDIFMIRVLAIMFFASSAVSLVGAKARHPSWVAFLVIGLLCLKAVSLQ